MAKNIVAPFFPGHGVNVKCHETNLLSKAVRR